MEIANGLLDKWADLSWRLMPDWEKEYFVASREQWHLTERNDKYWKITNALWLGATFNPIARFLPGRPIPGIAPGIWIAYHFCRKIDDIADGDCPLPQRYGAFLELVDDLKNAMDLNCYPDSDVGLLLRGTVRDMDSYHGVDIRDDISHFLDAMRSEQSRRVNRTVSTRAELEDIYQNSFGVPQDIAFICVGSRVRSVDVPELAQLQGRLYAVKDLPDELPRGIIFIPREVISDLSADELCSIYQLDSRVLAWKQEELNEGAHLIDRLRTYNLDWGARRIIGFLAKGIETYIQQAGGS